MIRTIIALAGLCLAAAPAIPEHDPDSAREVYLRERFALLAPAVVSGPAPARKARRVAPPPALAAIVDRWADRFGVPRDIARFHVAHESSWNVRARNPRSSATGLFQPVRASQAAILGRDQRDFTTAEHVALARDPELNAQIGLAHIRACMDFMPNATAAALWRRCHVAGHAAVGGDIRRARAHFARVVGAGPAAGWVALGSAVPWITLPDRSSS